MPNAKPHGMPHAIPHAIPHWGLGSILASKQMKIDNESSVQAHAGP
jgi:hypothetical protein